MDELKGKLPEASVTYLVRPQEFRVLGETEEYYVIELPDGKPSAIEKDKTTVVVISGYIT